MIKEKKCKGHGVAKGFGCGKMIDVKFRVYGLGKMSCYRDWETDRKSTRLNSSHSGESRMPSSA